MMKMSSPTFNSDFSSVSTLVEDFEALYTAQAQSPLHKRKASAEHNAAMRDLMKPWGSIAPSPPGCRSIMYSSWSRFNAGNISSKSSDDLKASILWAGTGTTPDFNPPVLERTYLGVVQEKPGKPGKPRGVQGRRRSHRKQSDLRNSWSTLSSGSDAEVEDDRVTFKRQAIKSVSTSSLISSSLRRSQRVVTPEGVNPMRKFAETFGVEFSDPSMLPSAFSDSEDEGEVGE